MNEKIDIGRCLLAMEAIIVHGRPSTKGARGQVLADAIAAIQADGTKALTAGYLGVKNYAGFGDLRNDGLYHTGPRHGSTVFSVERVQTSKGEHQPSLNADHVYLLECVRDCAGLTDQQDHSKAHWRKHMNLCDVLQEREKLLKRLDELGNVLCASTVESHAACPSSTE